MFHPQFYWGFCPATVLELIVLLHINYMRIFVKKHLLLFTLLAILAFMQVIWREPSITSSVY